MWKLTAIAACLAGLAPAQEEGAFREVLRIDIRPEVPLGVGLTRDGARAVVILDDGRVRVWDVAAFTIVAEFTVEVGAIEPGLLFFGDDRFVALDQAGSRVIDLQRRVLVTPDATQRTALAKARELDASDYWVRRAAVPARRDRSARRVALVVAADRAGHVELWQSREVAGQPRAIYGRDDLEAALADHDPRPHAISFTADGRFLCMVRGTRVVVESLDGTRHGALPHRGLAVRPGLPAACPGTAGPEVWLVDDRTVTLWNIGLERPLREWRCASNPPIGPVHRARSSPNGRYLLLHGVFGTFTLDTDGGNWEFLTTEQDGLALHQDGESVLAAFRFRDPATRRARYAVAVRPIGGREATPILETEMPFESLRVVPDSQLVLAGGYGDVALFDLDEGTLVATASGAGPLFAALSRELAMTANEDRLTLRSLPSLEPHGELGFENAEIRSIHASPDRTHLAIELADRVIVLAVSRR